MKKRDYTVIDNLTTLLTKEVNADFLRACDTTADTPKQTMSLCVENEVKGKPEKIKHNTSHKVAPSKAVGARLLATDIYKGLLRDYKKLGAGVFTIEAFQCVKCQPIHIILNDNGCHAHNQLDIKGA